MTLVDVSMVDTGIHEAIMFLGAAAFIGAVVIGAIWFSDGKKSVGGIFLLLCLLNVVLFTAYNTIDKCEIHSYIVDDYDLLDETLEEYKIYSQPEKGYYKLIKEREY